MGEIYTTERPLISQVIVLNGKRLSFGIWQNGIGEVVAKNHTIHRKPGSTLENISSKPKLQNKQRLRTKNSRRPLHKSDTMNRGELSWNSRLTESGQPTIRANWILKQLQQKARSKQRLENQKHARAKPRARNRIKTAPMELMLK